MKAVLILFAVLGGFILAWLGLPASFLTGPLLMAAIFAVTNRPVIRFPLFIYRLAQSVIGVMLSFTITAKSLQTIVTNWAPIVILVISMLVLTTLLGIGLRRFANLQPGTALLGALPGGVGEMIAMSDSIGADARLVTVMQYGRLLAILATISVVGHFHRRYSRGMRPLRYFINVTLDGCCDHRAMIPDGDLHRHAAENLDRADALLFGRVTYEMMEAAWRPPARAEARPEWMEPFARTIDAAKKYVVSSTLDRVDWNAELVCGDLGKAVQELKRETGKGLLVGGVKLPQALAELGLIDEYEFVVQPTLAGHGPTLFAGLSKRVDLRLVSRKEFGSGAVAMRYEPRR